MLWDSVREQMGKIEMKHSGRLGQFRRLNSRCSQYWLAHLNHLESFIN